MPEYDDVNYDPPAPVAWVMLRNPVNGKTLANVPMLLDTGADASLLPMSCMEPLGIQRESRVGYELVAFDGTRSVSHAAVAHLVFLGMTFRGRYLLRDDAMGVIGRDVLNHLTIRFNGKTLTWELETP
jgi:hypothetical protein